mmetsp:Transcript_35105/g.75964  ORF Transcript_35105/g.75964 Transcript_35105/m.75964 type:complete len:80 (-) Transcript_35105:633-872(-)
MALRGKELSWDYRFMPEPDLPPLILTCSDVETAAASLPELPDAAESRLIEEMGLRPDIAKVLVYELGGVAFLDQVRHSL